MKSKYVHSKKENLDQLVREYENERLQKIAERTDNNKYMESLALAKLEYQEEQKSTSYDESVIDLSLGSFDQRMRWWTAIHYENLATKMFNLYLNKNVYRIRPLPDLITIMKEPKKYGGYRFGVDYRKFYDRYVKS